MNFFKKLKESLKKTSEKFTKGIDEVFNKSKPQAEILQDIEDILIQADVGINFVEEFRKNIANKNPVIKPVMAAAPVVRFQKNPNINMANTPGLIKPVYF